MEELSLVFSKLPPTSCVPGCSTSFHPPPVDPHFVASFLGLPEEVQDLILLARGGEFLSRKHRELMPIWKRAQAASQGSINRGEACWIWTKHLARQVEIAMFLLEKNSMNVVIPNCVERGGILLIRRSSGWMPSTGFKTNELGSMTLERVPKVISNIQLAQLSPTNEEKGKWLNIGVNVCCDPSAVLLDLGTIFYILLDRFEIISSSNYLDLTRKAILDVAEKTIKFLSGNRLVLYAYLVVNAHMFGLLEMTHYLRDDALTIETIAQMNADIEHLGTLIQKHISCALS